MRPARVRAAVATVGVLAVSLAGCQAWFDAPGPETSSTPTYEQVASELEPFYHQVLQWESCGNGMQCATATAPMDWANPAGVRIELALVRKPATGSRRGSLLINPGGPGGSGVDFVLDSVDAATSERLQERFDIVGFDPRGVGRSSAVSCYDDPAVLDEFNYGIIPGQEGSDAWLAEVTRQNAQWGQACLEHTGPLLQYVDTISASRDLDLLRAVLGDARLNYLGYSYGTFLGTTYAELFPHRTGRLVFDGAVDPAAREADVTKAQAVGFERAYRSYLQHCVGRDDCPFRGDVAGALDRTREILDRLLVSPLTAPDGRQLGADTLFIAIILPLYNEVNWPYLDDLFTEVLRGQTQTAFLLADSYNERNPDGTYASNSTEAFVAINCLDYPRESADPERMRAEAAELERLAPVFGPRMAYGATGCAQWPFPPVHERGAMAAAGSADILVVGTTNDPATPYEWARSLAAQLENGHLVTYHGQGHTAYNKSNQCVNDVVDDFLIDGTVPSGDVEC